MDNLFSFLILKCTTGYISELLLKGRTVGKYITGTKVVTIFGEIPNSSQVLKKNLI